MSNCEITLFNPKNRFLFCLSYLSTYVPGFNRICVVSVTNLKSIDK